MDTCGTWICIKRAFWCKNQALVYSQSVRDFAFFVSSPRYNAMCGQILGEGGALLLWMWFNCRDVILFFQGRARERVAPQGADPICTMTIRTLPLHQHNMHSAQKVSQKDAAPMCERSLCCEVKTMKKG